MDFTEIGTEAPILIISAAGLEEAFRTVIGELLAEKEAEEMGREVPRREVANRLGVAPSTLWRWDKAGYLRPFRRGSKVFYRESDVEDIEKGRLTE
jgi:hypothetical protein